VHIQLRFGRHIDTSSEILSMAYCRGELWKLCLHFVMLDSTLGEDAHEGVRKTQLLGGARDLGGANYREVSGYTIGQLIGQVHNSAKQLCSLLDRVI
jgi:hypothetical protein